jgi:hypothetical protein
MGNGKMGKGETGIHHTFTGAICNRVRKWRHNFRDHFEFNKYGSRETWVSPELPRSVGRDVNDATAGGRYGWIWLTFWTFIIQR